MEALNVLRIEKGFITHAEIDGRVTAFDLGMGHLMSTKKDFIGKTASQRSGLLDPRRPRLVGLKPIGPVKQLTAGSHLFNNGDPSEAKYDRGYVSSVAYSPMLERFHGLAFLKEGADCHGQKIRLVDHVRGIEAICEVTSPIAFDPMGERARV